MLVLTRSKGESIHLGENIVLKVTDIRGGRVLLGIGAPEYVSVHRQEVAIRVQESEPAGHSEGPGNEPPRPT